MCLRASGFIPLFKHSFCLSVGAYQFHCESLYLTLVTGKKSECVRGMIQTVVADYNFVRDVPSFNASKFAIYDQWSLGLWQQTVGTWTKKN